MKTKQEKAHMYGDYLSVTARATDLLGDRHSFHMKN